MWPIFVSTCVVLGAVDDDDGDDGDIVDDAFRAKTTSYLFTGRIGHFFLPT